MRSSVSTTIKELLNQKLQKLEEYFDADVFCYYGNIQNGLESVIVGLIEDLATSPEKKNKLVVILTTGGGSAIAVERYVQIIRYHYEVVDFIVPDFAYSAGTIFCMSGDNIYMDYSSVLGPIDPQVQNREGKWVAALGYLDKVNEAIEKSKNKTLTEVEFLMVKDLDLAELRGYEQARDLTIQLLKKWLVNYKFKNWDIHQTTLALLGSPVTPEQKVAKAEHIASMLNRNDLWNTHGRPINAESLRELGLKVENYSEIEDLRRLIREYYGILSDYINPASNPNSIFVHTRKYI